MRRNQLEHIIRAAFGITAAPELVAGRDKELKIVAGLLRHELACLQTLLERLDLTKLDENRRGLCQALFQRITR